MYGSFWITFILLLLGGVIAASGFIISKKPDASELLDKITPFKGFIGLILLVFGIIHFFDTVGYWDVFFKWNAFRGLIFITAILLEIILGIFLGYGLIAKYLLSKNDKALETGDNIQSKLTRIQNPLGIAALVVAVLLLFYRIF